MATGALPGLGPWFAVNRAGKTPARSQNDGEELWREIIDVNSVITNVGAMVALQQLNKTNSTCSKSSSRINTGKRHQQRAKDNGAIWAIAQNQRATSSSRSTPSRNPCSARSRPSMWPCRPASPSPTCSFRMKDKALAASDTSLDAAARTALDADFQSLRDQVTKVVNNVLEFNGINLLKTGATDLTALANATGTKMTVQAQVMALGGSIVTVTAAAAPLERRCKVRRTCILNSLIANVSAALSKPVRPVRHSAPRLRRQAAGHDRRRCRQPGGRGPREGSARPKSLQNEAAGACRPCRSPTARARSCWACSDRHHFGRRSRPASGPFAAGRATSPPTVEPGALAPKGPAMPRRMERNVAAVAATVDMIAGDRAAVPKLEPASRRPAPEVEETVDLRLVIEIDEASGSYVYKTINRMTGVVRCLAKSCCGCAISRATKRAA